MAHIGLYLILLMTVVVVVLSDTTGAPTTTTNTPAPKKAPDATPPPDTIKEAVGAVLNVPKSMINACAEVTKAVFGSMFNWGK